MTMTSIIGKSRLASFCSWKSGLQTWVNIQFYRETSPTLITSRVLVSIPASTYVNSALVPKVLKKPVHPLRFQISTIMNSSASITIPIPPA